MSFFTENFQVVDLELMLSSGEIIKVSNTENAQFLSLGLVFYMQCRINNNVF